MPQCIGRAAQRRGRPPGNPKGRGLLRRGFVARLACSVGATGFASLLVKDFISEFHRETNRLNAERGRRPEAAKAELARVEAEIRNIISAVKQGMVHASMQDALTQLEKRKATLACEVAATPLPPPVIHPNLAEIYRRKVDRLHECLTASGTRTEAAEALRCLVDEIRLVPQDGALSIDLYGELGAVLSLTNDKAAPGARSGHSTG